MSHVKSFVAFVIAGLAAPGLAHAQGEPMPATAEPATAEPAPAEPAPAEAPMGPAAMPAASIGVADQGSKLWIGGQLGLSPLGSYKQEFMGVTGSIDLSPGFGLGGLFEYRVTPLISVGIAPAYLLHVKPKEVMGFSPESTTGLDLPLRVSAGGDVAPQIRAYGFLAPGYSILFPASDDVDAKSATGFSLGIGGGAGYKISPKLMVTGELGYHFRFLSLREEVPDRPIEFDFQANYLTFAFGIRAAID